MSKLTIGIIGIAAVTILVLIDSYFDARIREKEEALAAQTDRIARLEAQNERLSNLVVNVRSSLPQPSEPSRELLRLRGEVGVLRQQTDELVGVRKENIRLSQAVAEAETNQVAAEDRVIVQQNHAVDAMTTLLQGIQKYAADHNGEFPANLDQLIASGGLAATNLAGNLGPGDFEFGQSLWTDPQGNRTVLRLRVPISKPGGGGLMVVGSITEAGVPYTSIWNVAP